MRKNKAAAIQLWIFIFIATTAEVLYPPLNESVAYTIISFLSVMTLLLVWVINDAKCNDYNLPNRLKVWIFLLALIFVSLYLIKARGWKEGMKSMTIILLIISSLIAYAFAIDCMYNFYFIEPQI
ncbi:MAG: hypothetical protein D6B27_06755 [Gammaproteobacteria bacterium]|nr:MAG: hypothetical protein D6B27_06755 [Gammaproteobacteria bacterium]